MEILPIIFIHNGYSDYMEYSLRQAKYSNPDSEIILLGDKSNDKFDFITHINLEDYFSSASEFSEVYKHYSTNPYNYELFCVQRWFVLKEYMKQNNIEECFVCDTDVMIYSNIEEALNPFKENDVALLKHNDESFLLGISFLKLDSLESFCSYTMNSYKSDNRVKEFEKRYLEIISKNTVGGISDMILAANWLHDTNDENYVNLAKIENNTTFDRHVGTPSQVEDDKYKFRHGRKVITWQNNFPHCYSYKYEKDIRFHLLHFQGPAKYLMAQFYMGNSFAGKLRLDTKFFFANIAAFWYKTLRIRYRFAWLFNIIFKLKAK
jgi:hypothetical protein